MPDQITQAWQQALRDKAEAELRRRAREIRRRTADALVIEDRVEKKEDKNEPVT